MKRIHLCIISDQPLPNLIPILQDKPDYVALIVSKEKSQEAINFKETLRYCGYDTDAVFIYQGIPDSGLEYLQLKALEIIDTQSAVTPNARFIYNATGGNKIMALAFASQFMEASHEVFYADTAHGRLETLYPTGTNTRIMEQVLDVNIYLKAYGETVRKVGSASEPWVLTVQNRRSLTYWIATNIQHLESAVGCLNSAVGSALSGNGNGIDHPLQDLPFYPKHQYLEYLKKLGENKLIQWDAQRASQVCFDSIEGASYVSGGWLEEYAWLVANDLSIHSVAANIEITDDIMSKSNIRNELDLVAVHNNRMIIIEVKTSKFGNRQDKDNEIVYKIDALAKKVGGVFCKRILLSAMPVDHTTKGGRDVNVTHRAASHRVDVLDGGHITDLKDSLQKWMSAS